MEVVSSPPAGLARLRDQRAAGGQHPGVELQRRARGRNLRDEQRGGNERGETVARARRRAGGCEPTDPAWPPRRITSSILWLPADSGSDASDLALIALVADVGAQRAAVGPDDRKLLDWRGANVAWRSASTLETRHASMPRRRKFVERGHRARDARLGQRHVTPRRQIEFVPALALDEAAEPYVERRHRRPGQDHADSDRCEQLLSRRHNHPAQNCKGRLNERR